MQGEARRGDARRHKTTRKAPSAGVSQKLALARELRFGKTFF